jgi:RNA polymerase sigma factor (sigma-70 family)
MNKLLGIFKSGKEQKLLDMLYGSREDRERAIVILRKEALEYCSHYGRRMGFCRDDRFDLLQDAMLTLLEALEEKKIKKNPVGYLKRIIKFKSIDKINQNKKLKLLNQITIEPSTIEDDEQKEEIELTKIGVSKMLQAMDFINPTYRNVIESNYFFFMSIQQIADEQQISYDTVKTQLCRARKALRDKLREL